MNVQHVVPDRALCRCPTGLELIQPLVFDLRSSETQGGIPILQIPANGFPHDQVVCPEVEMVLVGSTVFVESFPSRMKVDRCGDRQPFVVGDGYEPCPFGDQVSMQVFEETDRLWGKPMFLAGEAVEPIKMPNRFDGIVDTDFDPLFYRFPDISSRAVAKSRGELDLASSQFQNVVQKFLRRNCAFKNDFPESQFDGLPPNLFSIFRD